MLGLVCVGVGVPLGSEKIIGIQVEDERRRFAIQRYPLE